MTTPHRRDQTVSTLAETCILLQHNITFKTEPEVGTHTERLTLIWHKKNATWVCLWACLSLSKKRIHIWWRAIKYECEKKWEHHILESKNWEGETPKKKKKKKKKRASPLFNLTAFARKVVVMFGKLRSSPVRRESRLRWAFFSVLCSIALKRELFTGDQRLLIEACLCQETALWEHKKNRR